MSQIIDDIDDIIAIAEEYRKCESAMFRHALRAAIEQALGQGEAVACDCSQGQVCHICDPITPQPQQSEAESLAALGWQAIECSVCGSSAVAFPQPQRDDTDLLKQALEALEASLGWPHVIDALKERLK
jgi:hypothetical protein